MKKKMNRIQYSATPEALAEYKRLRKMTGLPTMAALVRDAMSLFGWVIGEVAVGRRICSYDKKEDEYTFYVTPEFIRVRKETEKTKKGEKL